MIDNKMHQLIVATYVEYDQPSDEIAADPVKQAEFTALLKTRILNEFLPENVAKTVVTLRKAGKLPRIRKAAKCGY